MPAADSTATLSPVQAQVIAALAQGRTVTAAAQTAGLDRNTIYNWLHEPAFKTVVDEAQREYVAILSDGMRDVAALALATLRAFTLRTSSCRLSTTGIPACVPVPRPGTKCLFLASNSCGSFRVWIYSANAPRHMSTHNARMRRAARRLNHK